MQTLIGKMATQTRHQQGFAHIRARPHEHEGGGGWFKKFNTFVLSHSAHGKDA